MSESLTQVNKSSKNLLSLFFLHLQMLSVPDPRPPFRLVQRRAPPSLRPPPPPPAGHHGAAAPQRQVPQLRRGAQAVAGEGARGELLDRYFSVLLNFFREPFLALIYFKEKSEISECNRPHIFVHFSSLVIPRHAWNLRRLSTWERTGENKILMQRFCV